MDHLLFRYQLEQCIRYRLVTKMYHIQLERGENFLLFDIKFALENVSINEIEGHFSTDYPYFV